MDHARSMTIEPLHRANFVDQAYQAIKQLIIGGELAPGSALNIDALARRLGVSNSPIREALRRLEYERWVETVPFRGARVRPLEQAELVELYEFREIIELAALGKLMDGGGAAVAGKDPGGPGFERGFSNRQSAAENVQTLRRIVDDIGMAVKSGDAMQYLRADAQFHQAIVDMAGNRRLSDLFRTLVEQGRSFMLGRTPEAMARYREQPEEHAQLLAAIERGHRSEAVEMLKAHLRISLDDIRETMEKGEGPR